MQTNSYTLRTMTRQDLDLAIGWAAAEGWNPGLHDAACFHAADPDGFLIGLLGDEPVAAISVVKYGERFGFLGFYIVKPEHRGKGYGLRIWNAGLERLAGRVIGLDGVVSQQENYAKSGFSLAHRNVRYRGTGGGSAAEDSAIVPLSSLPFGSILDFDSGFFPEDRSAFLEAWLRQPGATALGWTRQGKLAGYGMIRPCRSGYKTGPLFAETPEIAECLFTALKARVPGDSPLFLDVPETNRNAVKLAENHGMEVIFETARMYSGNPPALPLQRIYGITTFELG